MLDRNARVRAHAAAADESSSFAAHRASLAAALAQVLRRHPVDALGLFLIAAVVAAILVNALYLQVGAHPAPMLSTGVAAETTGSLVALPRPRPAEPQAATKDAGVTPRPRAAVLSDIQRELARRGFYDGPVDGIHGPKMDAAVRDFEQAAGLRPGGEPGETLLQALAASPLKANRTRPAPQPRVLAAQRALSEFGYGQIKQTGLVDDATKAAIEKFERDRKLPVSGRLSDRLMRELAAVTGRPLE